MIKRMLAGILLIFVCLALGVTGTFLLLDNTTVMALITQQIESATGTRISYGKNAAMTRTLSPMITIHDLKIEDTSTHLQIDSSLFQLQISLPGILKGRLEIPKLVLGDTRVEIKATDGAGTFNLPRSFPLRPVLHDIRISQITIVRANERINLPAMDIEQLTVTVDPDTDKLICNLKTRFGDNLLDVVATLPRIQTLLEQQRLPFFLAVAAPFFHLSSEGLMDFRSSPPTIEADVQGKIPDLKQILALPKSVSIQGRADIRSEKGVPSLENIVVRTKDAKGIQVDLKGRIENLPALTGFDLTVNGRLENPTWLTAALPETLDPLKRMTLSTRISGAYPHLGIRECRLNGKTVNDLDLNVTGQLDLAYDTTGLQTENMALKLEFTAPSTRSARALFFDTIPEFGRVQGQADIRSKRGIPSLENIVVQTKDAKGITVDLNGRIAGFPFDPDISNTGYDLEVIMTSVKTSVMGERLGIDLPIDSSMDGPLDIRYRIEGDTQALQLNKIDLSAGKKNGVQIGATGRVLFGKWDQADPIERIDLAVRLESRNTLTLGKALGKELPELGPVKLDSAISKKGKGIQCDTQMTAGETRMNAVTSIVSRRGTPFISGKIKAHNVFIPDLIEKENKAGKDGPAKTGSFFSREPLTVDWLKKADVDLFVDIASFDKQQMTLESAQFRVALESGRLSIESARLAYPKGEITLDMRLELEKDLRISVKASGKDINPWLTLSIQQPNIKNDFDAELDIDMEITSFGKSEYDLVANMEGDIYVILKNGKMRKEPLDMLFTDLIGWTIGKATGQKYVDIDCGVADYSITRGVITTNAFIIDARDITVAGEGTIDLSQEQIDYVFLPKKKSSLILKAEPVKVTGPLTNPSVKVLPWKSAAATYGSLFFGPYVFAGWVAFDFLKSTISRGSTTSPCSEYEKKHEQEMKPAAENQPFKE